MRPVVNSGQKEIYFGQVNNGAPTIGVIQVADGYVAGKFEHGQLKISDERSEFIAAFREAESAAKAVSVLLRQAGDGAGAEFYKRCAEELAQQLD